MAGLVVHGGVGEIGGNKVQVDATHGRLFLDFGLSFKEMDRYYSEFCQPRGHSYVGDQIHLGMLPDLEGAYRPDLQWKAGRPADEARGVDAVFASHAHLDHVGMVPVLRPDVPIHLAPASRAILETLDTTGQSFGMPDRFLDYTPKFQMVPARGGGVKRGTRRDLVEPREVVTFAPGEEVQVAEDLVVRPLAVDHSLPGACGFLVHVDGRTWAYTGDLRFHGTHQALSRTFMDALSSEDVDVLVTEGTRVGEGRGASEAHVREEVARLVQEADGLVLANYPPRDLDRIESFYEAARSAGRELVVDARQALLLENLRAALGEGVPRLGDGVRVLARRQGWGVVGMDGYPPEVQEKDYRTWEQPLVLSPHGLLDHEVAQDQDRYVVFVDFYHLQVLVDLRPRRGSIFVRSLVEPFNEEMELDEARVNNWMRRFDLEVHQVHASGHACGEDLRGLVSAAGPRVVVPVHTEEPEAFRAMHHDVRVPEQGRATDL